MKKGVYISFIICCMLGGLYIDANAQTLKNYAKQRNQELAERQRMEKSNYEKACQKGTLAAYNEYLSMYPKGKYVQDVKKRVVEIERKNEQDLYEYAAKLETAQAYEAYLKKYPNGRFAQEARGRMEDMELWKKAKSVNTIAAYRYYLSTSRNKSFANLANDAIVDLESIDEWNKICHSSSKETIESFILKYPKSSRISIATKKHDEFLAVELYEQGNLQRAYEKFESAGGRYVIESHNRSKYDECAEYVDFKNLNSYSNETDLIAFLRKYPSSRYYNQVSNMVAVSKAKSLSTFSGIYQFDDAMSYAKDETTKHTVKTYIQQAKEQRRSYERNIKAVERQRKAIERRTWWKNNFQIGIDADYGTNMDSDPGADMFYSVGLVGRFGDCQKDWNFVTGIKYRWLRVMPEYGSYYNKGGIEWQMFGGAVCIPISVRYNIAEVFYNSRVYIGIGGEYGFISEKNIQDALNDYYISIFPQFGITSRHFEVSSYIKNYIASPFKDNPLNNSSGFDCRCLLGVQMAIYF